MTQNQGGEMEPPGGRASGGSAGRPVGAWWDTGADGAEGRRAIPGDPTRWASHLGS